MGVWGTWMKRPISRTVIVIVVAAIVVAAGGALFVIFNPSQKNHIEIVDYTHRFDTMVPGMRVVAFAVNLTNKGSAVESAILECHVGTEFYLYTTTSVPFAMNPATTSTYGNLVAIPIYDTSTIVSYYCHITPYEA